MAWQRELPPPQDTMSFPRLTMAGIAKRFGPTLALGGVDLVLRPGEIHALVGENGAGKSTLMKILSGAETPDAGRMLLDGVPYAPAGPLEARRRGVAMIYQELALAEHLTVEANLLLGLEHTRFGFLRHEHNRQRAAEALAVLEHPEILPETPVGSLSTGARQLVEVARALLLDVRVLILDEPTSALTQEDAQRLFALIRRLREQGVTVVYISHFLEEIEQVADRFTVLRDGRTVGGGEVGMVSRDEIIALMIGRSLSDQFPNIPHTPGDPILELNGLSGVTLPRDVSLMLQRGEILGIAGIVGAGRTELLRAVFGLDPVRRGEIRVRLVSSPSRGPRQRLDQGLGWTRAQPKHRGQSDLQPARALSLVRLAEPHAAAERGSGMARQARRALHGSNPAGRRTLRRQSAEGGPRPAPSPGSGRAAPG